MHSYHIQIQIKSISQSCQYMPMFIIKTKCYVFIYLYFERREPGKTV